jgi:hypothetical protein
MPVVKVPAADLVMAPMMVVSPMVSHDGPRPIYPWLRRGDGRHTGRERGDGRDSGDGFEHGILPDRFVTITPLRRRRHNA